MYAFKAMGSHEKVPRLVDNEKKSTIGSIYHEMLEAKELINKTSTTKANIKKSLILLIEDRVFKFIFCYTQLGIVLLQRTFIAMQ